MILGKRGINILSSKSKVLLACKDKGELKASFSLETTSLPTIEELENELNTKK